MNKIILLGRMVRDPEVIYTQAAEPLAVCRFTVACNRPKQKDKDQQADFVNCVAFGKPGESIGKYFCKGNRIAVTGRLQISSYTDQQGNKKYSTDVLVEDFEFCETKAESESAGFTPAQTSQASVPSPTAGFSIAGNAEDEDLPF